MLVALLSVAGIILGAALQYIFTRVLEDRRHRRDLRTQAYADYIRGVAELKHLVIQPSAGRKREILARFTDAKVRVCLYGTPEVVAMLSQFESLGGGIDSDDQQIAFTDIIIAMRGKDKVTGKELEVVLMKPRV